MMLATRKKIIFPEAKVSSIVSSAFWPDLLRQNIISGANNNIISSDHGVIHDLHLYFAAKITNMKYSFTSYK